VADWTALRLTPDMLGMVARMSRRPNFFKPGQGFRRLMRLSA
jgi:hypothetical protein